jgi:hypothetical protein
VFAGWGTHHVPFGIKNECTERPVVSPAEQHQGQFEQISGRSLASTESLAEVWLAMRTTAAVPEG